MTTEDRVRSWARGMYAAEAGVEVLIRGGLLQAGAPWLVDQGARLAVDVDRLRLESEVWSGGQQRLARIAMSLLGGEPVDLARDLPGLEREEVRLVAAAVSHAAGMHELDDVRLSTDGRIVQYGHPGPIVPWP